MFMVMLEGARSQVELKDVGSLLKAVVEVLVGKFEDRFEIWQCLSGFELIRIKQFTWPVAELGSLRFTGS
jgi:hypothetical protein